MISEFFVDAYLVCTLVCAFSFKFDFCFSSESRSRPRSLSKSLISPSFDSSFDSIESRLFLRIVRSNLISEILEYNVLVSEVRILSSALFVAIYVFKM